MTLTVELASKVTGAHLGRDALILLGLLEKVLLRGGLVCGGGRSLTGLGSTVWRKSPGGRCWSGWLFSQAL